MKKLIKDPNLRVLTIKNQINEPSHHKIFLIFIYNMPNFSAKQY